MAGSTVHKTKQILVQLTVYLQLVWLFMAAAQLFVEPSATTQSARNKFRQL